MLSVNADSTRPASSSEWTHSASALHGAGDRTRRRPGRQSSTSSVAPASPSASPLGPAPWDGKRLPGFASAFAARLETPSQKFKAPGARIHPSRLSSRKAAAPMSFA